MSNLKYLDVFFSYCIVNNLFVFIYVASFFFLFAKCYIVFLMLAFTKLAGDVAKTRAQPMRAKKLYVLGGIMVCNFFII